MWRSSSSVALRVAAFATVLAALVAAPAAQPATDARWKLAADLRIHLADAERALILGQPAAARAHLRKASPSASRLTELLNEGEIRQAVSSGRACGRRRRRGRARGRPRDPADRGAGSRLPEGAREHRARSGRRGRELAARARVPAAESLLQARGGRDARARVARRGPQLATGGRRGRAGRLPGHVPGSAAERARGSRRGAGERISVAPGSSGRARPGVLRHPRAIVSRAARRAGGSAGPRRLRPPAGSGARP